MSADSGTPLDGNAALHVEIFDLKREADAIRADRDALAEALRIVLDVCSNKNNETLWEIINAKQALANHGGGNGQ